MERPGRRARMSRAAPTPSWRPSRGRAQSSSAIVNMVMSCLRTRQPLTVVLLDLCFQLSSVLAAPRGIPRSCALNVPWLMEQRFRLDCSPRCTSKVPVTRRAGDPMPKSMVGLLAAVGAIMFALAPSAHGVLFLLAIGLGAVAAGLAAYGALCPAPVLSTMPPVSLPENKKKSSMSVTCPVTT